MTPALLTEWSRLLLGTLARAGVEHVVLSPGSRSTPFAWAALNEPKLRCHSVWDERVAAFFALGQARVSGRPSLLLCTSGTAAANYYPALIEASLAHLPVLVLTADRLSSCSTRARRRRSTKSNCSATPCAHSSSSAPPTRRRAP